MKLITIYQKPTCSKCRETMKLLEAKGVELHSINYFIDPIPAATLRDLLKKLGIPARGLMRKKEETYRTLRLADADLSEEELIGAMVQHPELIERPIVVRGKRAVLGRPPENINQLFE